MEDPQGLDQHQGVLAGRVGNTAGHRQGSGAELCQDLLGGKPADAATGELAGKLAVAGAVPLRFNAYKIPLMRNLVKRAIGGVEEATWGS